MYAQNVYPANGNVGIGTTNPSAKLDVNGKAIIDSTLIVKDSVRFKDRLTVDKKVLFKDDAKIKGKARIEGNIKGDQKLTIDGTARFNAAVKMPNIGNPNNGILNSQNYEILIKLPNGNVKAMGLAEIVNIAYGKYDCIDENAIPQNVLDHPVWSNGTGKIYTDLCNLVNVGIGTSTPAYKLDVKGTTYTVKLKVGSIGATDNAVINAFSSNNSQDIVNFGVRNNQNGLQSEVLFKITNNGTVIIKTRNQSNALVSHNSVGNEIFKISDNGTVTMNVQSGKAMIIYGLNGGKIMQLEGNGMLRARKIKVDLDNWADYVFEDDYKLLTLSELATYIKQYKHLPNIPTAKQIKRNGLSLGDMQRLQMEKIEELTLYTIQQDNKINKLENTVQDLQNQLDEIKELLNK